MTRQSQSMVWALLAGLVGSAGCARRVPPELVPLMSVDGKVVDVPARRLSCPPALYPMTMQETSYEGRATIEFTIDTTGRADTASIHVIASDHPAFGRSARSALEHCRFAPARIGGRPVATRARITYSFTAL